jgi:hypothetical protein
MTLAKLKEVIIAAEDVEDYGKSRSETINNNFSNQDLMQLCDYWWKLANREVLYLYRNYLDFDCGNMREFSSWIDKKEFLELINERFDEDKSDEFGCERISDKLFEEIIQGNFSLFYACWIETMRNNMSSRDKAIYSMSEYEYERYERLIIKHSPDEVLLLQLRDCIVSWATDEDNDIRYIDYDAFIKWTNIKNIAEIPLNLNKLYENWIDEIYDSLDAHTQKLLDLSLEDYLNTTGYSKKQLELIEKAINTGNPSKNLKKLMNSEKFYE